MLRPFGGHSSLRWPTCVLLSALLAVLLVIAGCSTKHVDVPKMVRTDDTRLSCSDIKAEIDQNLLEAARLAGQDQDTQTTNTILAVGMLITWIPVAIGGDFSQESRIKMNALKDRNEYLGVLWKQRAC